jgi:hypothetical protein
MVVTLHQDLKYLSQRPEVTENINRTHNKLHAEYQCFIWPVYLVILTGYNIQNFFYITLLIFHILLLFPVVFWFAELFPIPQFLIHEFQGCHRLLFDVDYSELYQQLRTNVNERE